MALVIQFHRYKTHGPRPDFKLGLMEWTQTRTQTQTQIRIKIVSKLYPFSSVQFLCPFGYLGTIFIPQCWFWVHFNWWCALELQMKMICNFFSHDEICWFPKRVQDKIEGDSPSIWQREAFVWRKWRILNSWLRKMLDKVTSIVF